VPKKDIQIERIRTTPPVSAVIALMINGINMDQKTVYCSADDGDLEAIAGDWAIDFDFPEDEIPRLVELMDDAITEVSKVSAAT